MPSVTHSQTAQAAAPSLVGAPAGNAMPNGAEKKVAHSPSRQAPAVDVKISEEAKRRAASGVDDSAGAEHASGQKSMDDLVDFYANKLRRAAKRLDKKEQQEVAAAKENEATMGPSTPTESPNRITVKPKAEPVKTPDMDQLAEQSA